MSKGFNSSFSSQLSSSTANQTDLTSQTASQNIALPASSAASAGPSTWQPPPHWNLDKSVSPYRTKIAARLNSRLPEEQEIIPQTAARVASRIAADHAAVLKADVDSPFSDYPDVVRRLLPYHVFQQPQDDLVNITHDKKGKGKAIDCDIKTDIAETKFAIECYRRKESLKKRFRNLGVQHGKRGSPDNQGYVLAQAVLEADRLDMTWLSNELRTARGELDKIEKDKRAVANVSRAATIQNAYAQYYRSYPYSYAQPYGATAPLPSGTISTFSIAPSVQTPVAAANTPYQAGAAIPVQLPVASLPALHALGIVPVPAANLPSDGQPPPAVLRGSSANGTMLSLEINVSLLQSAQMSGLAMVLNSLMSRSGVTANYASAAAPSSSSKTNSTHAGSLVP
ncbi:hypothetical protein M378DRAFT_75523 [Amanita muscaria Koide BX008]|uniref:GLTSCR protein conserved domain-containing protein n=1 Tax=Amanita muscaria (strain Koide BX008) TaxID=946122 RepID=A0A0C2XBN6_AMAMK|nr:hypothetical protein M378DRAFT_75523 [Amanita muscaria Koide BX008]